MARIHILVLLLGALIALTSASSAPTFCKCTCFKNSTIIPLGPQKSDASSSSSKKFHSRDSPLLQPIMPSRDHGTRHEPRSASKSCSACTKAFCLNQGINFCKEAKEEDVMTMCFQRDSNKDKIIVWGFILGTFGLLGWASFKRWVEWRNGRAVARQDIGYAPVAGQR